MLFSLNCRHRNLPPVFCENQYCYARFMKKYFVSAWGRVAAMFALFTIELLLILALFLSCIVVFLFLAAEILQGGEIYFDQAAFRFMDGFASEGFTVFMVFMSFLGSAGFISGAAITLIVYFLFVKKHRWYSLKVPVIAVGSISLNLITKFFFNRERPIIPHLVEASGLSFPSGHSMVSASFYGLLIYLVWVNVEKSWLRHVLCAALTFVILLIGASRIYLHVHYATDVTAGFAAGWLWVILAVFGLRKLEAYSKRNVKIVVQEEPVNS